MTFIESIKDVDALTMTIVTQFDASPDRVWDVWEDPRKLERWWGPPTYPATFTRHEFTVGGQSRFYMTGPAGDKHWGWWRIDTLDPPHRLTFANGLAGDDGEPTPGIEPMGAVVTLEAVAGGTRMTAITNFVDTEQMQAMINRGMEEGMTQAMGQLDELLSPAAV